MRSGSSPGNDGLLIEFYRTFWNVVGGSLVVIRGVAITSFISGGLSSVATVNLR